MREHAKLLLSVVLVGCSSGVEEAIQLEPQLNLIAFSPMHSAFDGVHDYAVTPSVPSAAPSSKDPDPVLAASINWEIDGAFVTREEFPELPAAIKLTTKQAGTTKVRVTAKTLSGLSIRSEAQLTISRATVSEWEAGESRYNNGDQSLGMRPPSMCGLDMSITVPGDSACGNCHNSLSIAIEPTPTQTSGYSDEQLIKIFTEAVKPAGGVFNSPFLRAAPMPECSYKEFHTWAMSDEEKKGIVWKLRSIPPRAQDQAL